MMFTIHNLPLPLLGIPCIVSFRTEKVISHTLSPHTACAADHTSGHFPIEKPKILEHKKSPLRMCGSEGKKNFLDIMVIYFLLRIAYGKRADRKDIVVGSFRFVRCNNNTYYSGTPFVLKTITIDVENYSSVVMI